MCSPPTTPTAATAIPTTCRCTASAAAPVSWPTRPIVLEATINRDLIRMGADLATSLGFELPPEFNPDSFDHWYTPADELTHAVDVRAHLAAKRASMEAHASQATSAEPEATRSFGSFLSLPPDYFELAFGTEFFVDRDRPPGIAATDIFEPRPS